MNKNKEAERPEPLTAANFESQVGFPLTFALATLTGGIENQAMTNAFNLAAILFGASGPEMQQMYFDRLRVGYVQNQIYNAEADAPKKEVAYNAADLVPHSTVAGVIYDDILGTYVVLDHIKHDMLTFPVGKVEEGETNEQALVREMQEEVGITPTKFHFLREYKRQYDRNGTKVPVTTYLYAIEDYEGVVMNKEPDKHKSLSWMSIRDMGMSKRKLADCVMETIFV